MVLLAFAFALVSVGRLTAQTEISSSLRLLTQAKQIRELPPAEAALGYPVRIRGTVTFIDPGRTLFLQDSSGGTFVRYEKQQSDIPRGTEVSIEGVTYPGLYLPGISPNAIRVIGKVTVPTPRSVTLDDLSSGRFNYEWVQVRGIVRNVEHLEKSTILLLGLGDGLLEVHAPPEMAGMPLVDSAVRIEGLAAGFINDRRQLVAPHLRIASSASVTVEVASPPDPFEVPIVPVEKLLQFSPTAAPGHRIKVAGVLTHHEPGASIYLRDGEQGLYIQTRQHSSAKAGDHVEVLGFPAMGAFSAELEHATFRTVSSGAEPEPVAVDTAAIFTGRHDADLVRITGHLLKVVPGESGDTLLLQSGDAVFPARLPAAATVERELRPGMQLEVAGVCHVSQAEKVPVGFRSRPRVFEILLRSAADVSILRAPSWWTAQRLGVVAGVLLAAALAALGWAAALRRQVRRQTRLLKQKIQAEAVVEERHRIAREFHDTLEQELVGVSLRLDALATRVTDEKPRELLDGTRRLVQRLQTESRGFVWDLRESMDSFPDLAEAVRLSAKALSRDIEVRVSGVQRRFPSVVEHHLLRISHEALSNAVKHARARRLTVDLVYEPRGLLLRVQDDGIGIDPNHHEPKPGHFGMIGMQERAKKIGAEIRISGECAGSGTFIEVSAPFALPVG